MSSSPVHRILIVDDNEDAATSLAMLLSALGHETHTAHDGKSALAAVQAVQPEVVLLDIGLPDMDGYEVGRCLRQSYRRLRLIALTGYGQEEDIRRAREAGFDYHLLKPVGLEELRTLLAAF